MKLTPLDDVKKKQEGLQPMQRGSLTDAEWSAPMELLFKCTGCTPHRYFSETTSRRDYHLVRCPLQSCTKGVIVDMTEELIARNKIFTQRQEDARRLREATT